MDGDLVLGVQDGVVKLFPVQTIGGSDDATILGQAATAADAGDADTLAAANAHADAGDATTLAAAQAYTDSAMAGGGASVSYVNTQDASTLASANGHADAGDATTLSSANSHADAGDASTLSAAQAYADSVAVTGATTSYVDAGDASTLSSAHSYADSGDTTTLNSAKAYTDAATVGGNYVPTGTGATSRSMVTKVAEIECSVLDYGADKTGASDSSTAFLNAIHSGAKRIHVPAGTYRLNSTLTVDRNVELFGDGRENTIINSYVAGANHGMVIIGDSALARANFIQLRHFKFHYAGSGQATTANWSGIYIQRKVHMESVTVEQFTNDGLFFAPSDANEATSALGTIGNAVFFSTMLNVWSKKNGRDGIRIRMGANANTFINCDFSSNSGVGFHHLTDGGATYGNTIIAGQASYNTSYGYYFESGTNLTTMGLYAEYNGTPTNTNTDGYTNTPYDFYVGDNLSRSHIAIGTVFNNNNTHVRAPSSGLNDSIAVMVGGDRIFVSSSFHTPHEVSSQVDSTATDVAGLKTDFNALLAKLRNAGVIQ